jgi:hypothetical protein
MAIDRSTQFFTLDGLTVFKETVIKNYTKLGTIDAQINSVIYSAMMQYKRDIVKFVSTTYELPSTGNPGTLYMVPKHVDDTRYKPKTNEIWLTCEDAPFDTMQLTVKYYNPSRSNSTIDLVENEYGFFVLDINKITSEIASIADNTYVVLQLSDNNSLQIPYKDTASWYVKNDLIPMGGSIISIQKKYSLSNMIPIPQVYVGNKPDVTANIPEDEVWVDGTDWKTLVMHFKSSSDVLELHKNDYNYYVINKSDIDNIITGTSTRIWFATQDNELKTSADVLYVGKYIDTENITTYLGGKRIILRNNKQYIHSIPDTLPIITYAGDNGDQFVTYAYENGKYITLGSTKFSVDDFDIDSGLDDNSLNALQNKVIYDALQNKYNTADITDNVELGNNNIVTSRGIQAILASKLGWADLRNITLYQLMRELRFPWNMPTEMYFKLVVYAPLKEQDLAIFYPTLTQRMKFLSYGGKGSFVSTDNTFTYSTYSGTQSKYVDNNTGKDIWLQNNFDIAMSSSSSAAYLSGSTSNTTFVGNTGADIQFTITSRYPVNMNTLANLSYKFRAYSSDESSTHSHINKIYVSTYLSPDGVDWHTLQNKTIYKWDDNYEELNDYIYLIPILA